MARRSLAKLLMILVLGSPLSAPASRAGAEEPRDERDTTTTYTFDDDFVGGDRFVPLGEVLQVRAKKARESLVRVRTHFIVELYESVENL